MSTMTANYPTSTYAIPENSTGFYVRQEPSPASSASPKSPRGDHIHQQPPNPYKQLRPLKSPLYVPAVLRPTEHFSTPTTPPKSQHGSFDNMKQSAADAALQAAQGQQDLDFFGNWTHDNDLGDVTGPPTRDHWKPDVASPSCDSPHCSSNFNLFVRKHHCRHCGHIFCATHAPQTIPLDQNAKFHPDGIQSRACDTCFRQYQRWDTARTLRRKNSHTSEDSNNDGSGPPTPLAGSGSHRRMISGGYRGQQPEQVANSVPKDWAWSTF